MDRRSTNPRYRDAFRATAGGADRPPVGRHGCHNDRDVDLGLVEAAGSFRSAFRSRIESSCSPSCIGEPDA